MRLKRWRRRSAVIGRPNLFVTLVALGAALWWGARKSRDTDEGIKYMNEGRGLGRGILGVFGKGRNDRNS